jgi:hypothetical protein
MWVSSEPDSLLVDPLVRRLAWPVLVAVTWLATVFQARLEGDKIRGYLQVHCRMHGALPGVAHRSWPATVRDDLALGGGGVAGEQGAGWAREPMCLQ